MVLIADSGSTKCDWRLVDKAGNQWEFETMGLNPYFHDEEFIRREIEQNAGMMSRRNDVTHIFFYGAGCSSRKLKQVVEMGLAEVFPNAEVLVDHDLVASAFAVYQEEPCISCILGTGSNSCHFDGDIVREEVPALAYILGDEGSGSYFGKKLLSLYLYKKLPKVMMDALAEEYGLTKDKVMENVYMKPHANVYLASFMPFITRFKHEPFVVEMLKNGIRDFMEVHICCYKDYKRVKSHFIGSIAHYHEDILREVAKSMDISVGTILKKPIDGLVQYHINHYLPKLKL